MTGIKKKLYKTIAIAGTFDRLHYGHRFFISEAFKVGKKVVVGITSDEYVKKKLSVVSLPAGKAGCQLLVKAEGDQDTSGVANIQGLSRGGGISKVPEVEEFRAREGELRAFLQQKGLLDRAEIVKIDDIYGPTGHNSEIEALVVTRESLEGGRLVNKRRYERGLRLLRLLRIPIIQAQDRRKISSTRIRLGQIDREGKVYRQLSFWGTTISEKLRRQLKKPVGKLIQGRHHQLEEAVGKLKESVKAIQPIIISTIGDEVTKEVLKAGIKINIAVVDFKVSRRKKYHNLEQLYISSCKPDQIQLVANPRGHLNISMVKAVQNAISKALLTNKIQIIRIRGEEDLAAVPAIILSPLGSLVIYGQRQEGIVLVEVTEQIKAQLIKIIQKYSPR